MVLSAPRLAWYCDMRHLWDIIIICSRWNAGVPYSEWYRVQINVTNKIDGMPIRFLYGVMHSLAVYIGRKGVKLCLRPNSNNCYV